MHAECSRPANTKRVHLHGISYQRTLCIHVFMFSYTCVGAHMHVEVRGQLLSSLSPFTLLLFYFVSFLFETGFHYVTLACLGLST